LISKNPLASLIVKESLNFSQAEKMPKVRLSWDGSSLNPNDSYANLEYGPSKPNRSIQTLSNTIDNASPMRKSSKIVIGEPSLSKQQSKVSLGERVMMKTLHLGGWKFQSVKSFQSGKGPKKNHVPEGSKGDSGNAEGLSTVGKLPRRGTLDEKLKLPTREKTRTFDGTQETAVMDTLKRFKSTEPGLGVQGSPRF
jgi:hypothetical protein